MKDNSKQKELYKKLCELISIKIIGVLHRVSFRDLLWALSRSDDPTDYNILIHVNNKMTIHRTFKEHRKPEITAELDLSIPLYLQEEHELNKLIEILK